MERKDIDGNPVSLLELCGREPEWAANRIVRIERERDEARVIAISAESYGIAMVLSDRWGLPLDDAHDLADGAKGRIAAADAEGAQ